MEAAARHCGHATLYAAGVVFDNRRRVVLAIIVLGAAAAVMQPAYFTTPYDKPVLRLYSASMAVSKATAWLIKISIIFLLLPMCRVTFTWLRSTWVRHVLPFNDLNNFHKLMGLVLVVLSAAHVAAHCYNYYHASRVATLEQYFAVFKHASHQPTLGERWRSEVTITGLLMVVLLLFTMPFCAAVMPKRRKATSAIGKALHSYDNFWLSHHVLVVLLVVLLIIHPWPRLPNHVHPDGGRPETWVFIGAPVLLYTLEKLYRLLLPTLASQTTLLQARLLPQRVLALRLSKPPNFNAKSGHYIYLACPALSRFERHPFTLTSAPHHDYLSVMINCAGGDWTSQLYDLLEAFLQQQLAAEQRDCGTGGGVHKGRTTFRSAVITVMAGLALQRKAGEGAKRGGNDGRGNGEDGAGAGAGSISAGAPAAPPKVPAAANAHAEVYVLRSVPAERPASSIASRAGSTLQQFSARPHLRDASLGTLPPIQRGAAGSLVGPRVCSTLSITDATRPGAHRSVIGSIIAPSDATTLPSFFLTSTRDTSWLSTAGRMPQPGSTGGIRVHSSQPCPSTGIPLPSNPAAATAATGHLDLEHGSVGHCCGNGTMAAAGNTVQAASATGDLVATPSEAAAVLAVEPAAPAGEPLPTLDEQGVNQADGAALQNRPAAAVVVAPPELWVEGPYGTPSLDVRDYTIVMMVAAGIGITPFISQLTHIAELYQREEYEQYHQQLQPDLQREPATLGSDRPAAEDLGSAARPVQPTKKLKVPCQMFIHWVVRHWESLAWLEECLESIRIGPRLAIHVHVTGEVPDNLEDLMPGVRVATPRAAKSVDEHDRHRHGHVHQPSLSNGKGPGRTASNDATSNGTARSMTHDSHLGRFSGADIEAPQDNLARELQGRRLAIIVHQGRPDFEAICQDIADNPGVSGTHLVGTFFCGTPNVAAALKRATKRYYGPHTRFKMMGEA